MQSLRLYLAVLRIGLSSSMEYRANYIINTIITVLVSAAVQMYVWYAVYQNEGVHEVAGLSIASMMVYLSCSIMCYSLTRNGTREREASQLIRSGGLNAYLLKPVSHALYTLSLAVAERISQSAFVLLPGVTLLLVIQAQHPVALSWSGFLWALPFIVLGAVINFLMGLSLSYIAFWLDEVWALHAIKDIALGLLSGMMFPLSALPTYWREISSALPFQYLAYIPAGLMNGSISPETAPAHLVHASLWTVLCIGVMLGIWRLGLRRYSAFGG